MIKLGFICDSLQTVESYHLNSANSNLCHLVGVCLLNSVEPVPAAQFRMYEHPEQLLADIELVVVDIPSDKTQQVVTQVIKLGVNAFLSNWQDLSLSELSRLDQLSHEIGVKLGFGGLGYALGINNMRVSQPSITEIRRCSPIVSVQHFDNLMRFDLATALALNRTQLRKIRAYSVPNQAPIPSTLLVLIDFVDGSAICYTLNRCERNASFDVDIHHGVQTLHFDIPNPDCLDYKALDLNNLLNQLQNGMDPVQGVQLANSTVFVTETVYSKIRMQ